MKLSYNTALIDLFVKLSKILFLLFVHHYPLPLPYSFYHKNKSSKFYSKYSKFFHTHNVF